MMKKYKTFQIILIILFFPFSIAFLFFKKLINKGTKTLYQGQNAELNNKVDEINLRNAHILNTDLVEADYFFGCCSECAKYRGRVFSISGQDKRFPKKPELINCTCGGITFFPFIYGISTPIISDYINKKVDIIKFSNRPFVDDRTERDLQAFEEYRRYIENNEQKEADRIDYEKLCELLPNDVPKTFGAYRRMKNSKSSGFIKLQEQATSIGFKFHDI